MSIKLDALREAFNQAADQVKGKTGMEPLSILKIIGGILGGIVVVVWLAIILNKHRERRLKALQRPSKSRNAVSQRVRH